jgi:aspartate racemase
LEIIRFCQTEYGARKDSDFPSIVLYNLPAPDVVESNFNKFEVLDSLDFGISVLKRAGADFSFIACNSMDSFIPKLREKMDLLSLVEETVKEAKNKGFKTLGLLATETTIFSGRYQEYTKKFGMEILLPDRQDQITIAIRGILTGEKQVPNSILSDVLRNLESKGADAAILGCTDLPLAINQSESNLPLLDSVGITSRAAVKKYYE